MTDCQAFFIINKQNVARKISGGGDGIEQFEISVSRCFKKGDGIVSPVGDKEKSAVAGYFDRARRIAAFCSGGKR